jgi:hypothetical protein
MRQTSPEKGLMVDLLVSIAAIGKEIASVAV